MITREKAAAEEEEERRREEMENRPRLPSLHQVSNPITRKLHSCETWMTISQNKSFFGSIISESKRATRIPLFRCFKRKKWILGSVKFLGFQY